MGKRHDDFTRQMEPHNKSSTKMQIALLSQWVLTALDELQRQDELIERLTAAHDGQAGK